MIEGVTLPQETMGETSSPKNSSSSGPIPLKLARSLEFMTLSHSAKFGINRLENKETRRVERCRRRLCVVGMAAIARFQVWSHFWLYRKFAIRGAWSSKIYPRVPRGVQHGIRRRIPVRDTRSHPAWDPSVPRVQQQAGARRESRAVPVRGVADGTRAGTVWACGWDHRLGQIDRQTEWQTDQQARTFETSLQLVLDRPCNGRTQGLIMYSVLYFVSFLSYCFNCLHDMFLRF